MRRFCNRVTRTCQRQGDVFLIPCCIHSSAEVFGRNSQLIAKNASMSRRRTILVTVRRAKHLADSMPAIATSKPIKLINFRVFLHGMYKSHSKQTRAEKDVCAWLNNRLVHRQQTHKTARGCHMTARRTHYKVPLHCLVHCCDSNRCLLINMLA